MKVSNFTSSHGNAIANQFLIKDGHKQYFQSYESIIVLIESRDTANPVVTLDEHYWDYSKTTGKYRNQFLGEGIAATRAKIKSGEYKLADLN